MPSREQSLVPKSPRQWLYSFSSFPGPALRQTLLFDRALLIDRALLFNRALLVDSALLFHRSLLFDASGAAHARPPLPAPFRNGSRLPFRTRRKALLQVLAMHSRALQA